MTLSISRTPSKVTMLPGNLGSLSRGLPPTEPDTLFVLGSNGGMSVAPDANFPLLFGRNEPDVHVCVGVADPHVSRRHGTITRQASRWVVNNLGRLPIRLPGARLILGGDQAELPVGYTPLLIVAPHQEHLLQVRVSAGTQLPVGGADCEATTRVGKVWTLSHTERLVLACLSRRYLEREPHAQPLTWSQVADELNELQPEECWTWRRAAHIVSAVRKRLSASVSGLLEHEVAPPVGNALNHNLIGELLVSTTITKADLALLGD